MLKFTQLIPIRYLTRVPSSVSVGMRPQKLLIWFLIPSLGATSCRDVEQALPGTASRVPSYFRCQEFVLMKHVAGTTEDSLRLCACSSAHPRPFPCPGGGGGRRVRVFTRQAGASGGSLTFCPWPSPLDGSRRLL